MKIIQLLQFYVCMVIKMTMKQVRVMQLNLLDMVMLR